MATLPDTDVILFYDIPSSTPSTAWSPNTWKTRYALNLKRLPYHTVWVEYPDIAALLQSFGHAPTEPGTPTPYTLPAIFDPRTQRFVAESARIAAYLDDTYPDTPALSPKPLRPFQAAFQHAFATTVQPPILPLFLPRTHPLLQPASQPYFRRTREHMFRAALEEICPPPAHAQQWAAIERAFGVAAGWLDAAGDGLDAGDARATLIGEGKLTHADLSVAGWLVWMRIVAGRESAEWRAVEGWHGGRWKKLLDVVEPWSDCSR
ncbi:uncharacterized protein C8Q71DRAFT_281379 [Rhodofomes roseus]|uniref:GST N-terminal domain-containing protein n=1 Tax=Rhodofomes roseus TaxID=34475 RepID=A0ABQ8K548_9APHY|nr:uncharacterized protein C8Q71DRAFT_281379 [Rhodofomes roseus]KAH9832091.1 hypothetical protein C8Q71DRAFT_281379 [Rhodofomes roseus]